MKYASTLITVQCDPQGNPSRLEGKARQRGVTRVLDRWRAGGRWWEGEPPRDYFLLELAGGMVVEVYKEDREASEAEESKKEESEKETWVLSRVAD